LWGTKEASKSVEEGNDGSEGSRDPMPNDGGLRLGSPLIGNDSSLFWFNEYNCRRRM
jgi:hypothetical protein